MTIDTADAAVGERLRILGTARTVALVGVSANPLRSSNFVATYLVRTSYTVWPVNPTYEEVLGLRCYPALATSPSRPTSSTCSAAPRRSHRWSRRRSTSGPRWCGSNSGSRHEEAAAQARGAGLAVVQDRCLKIEHARFAGDSTSAGSTPA